MRNHHWSLPTDDGVGGASCKKPEEWMPYHDRVGKGDISIPYETRKVSGREECLALCKATEGAILNAPSILSDRSPDT